jgi:uncharacterized OB-fold protein
VSLLRPQPEGIPAPRPSLRSEEYWEGCRRHRLLYQQCAECGHAGLGAFTVCAHCNATSPVWAASAGLGTLYSWTVVWHPPNPSFHVPYAPAVVHLDEGVWMMSAVIGCEPDELHEDMPLSVEFHPASREIVLPYFTPRVERAHHGG